jgi:hypothetical protein
MCGQKGNRKGRCTKCKKPVSKTADEAFRRAEALQVTYPNIKNG